MKKRYYVLAVLLVLVVSLVSLDIYAEKEHESKKVELPVAVKVTVQAQFPQAEIEDVKMDNEGIMLYEVEVIQGEAEYELSIASDGTIVEQEEEIDYESLPEAVKQAIGSGEVEEVTKEVTYWVVTLQKLETPKVTYGVEVKQGDKEMEIEI